MAILGRIPLPVFVHTTALATSFTIGLCYLLAVVKGHVKPWLPMISDCAVLSPEKYPFRLGMVTSALLIGAEVVMIYASDKVYSRNKLALVLGLIASFSLGTVAVVNEVEDSPVHGTAAVIFFFLYWIYMILLTWGTSALYLLRKCVNGSEHPYPAPLTSWIRHVLTVVCGVALIAFAIMSSDWGKYQLYIAICEWFGTLCIILFNWSYADDLAPLSLAEIRNSDQSTINESKKVSL